VADAGDLAGLRVLVAEDEMLVSMLIEEALTDRQCTIVGPYSRVSDALEAARTLAVDAAVLDINLAGTMVYPVAEVLSARGIPFLLLSGYGSEAVAVKHASWRVCSKPFRLEDLIAMLAEQIASARQGNLRGEIGS